MERATPQTSQKPVEQPKINTKALLASYLLPSHSRAGIGTKALKSPGARTKRRTKHKADRKARRRNR